MKAFLLTGNMKGAARARMVAAIRGTGIKDVVVQVASEGSTARAVRGADILIVDVRYAVHGVTDRVRILHPDIPCVILTTTNSERIKEAIREKLKGAR